MKVEHFGINFRIDKLRKREILLLHIVSDTNVGPVNDGGKISRNMEVRKTRGALKPDVQEKGLFPPFLALWWSEAGSCWMLNPVQNTTGGEMR